MSNSGTISIVLSLCVAAWLVQMMLPQPASLDHEEQTSQAKPVEAAVTARPVKASAPTSVQLPTPPPSSAAQTPKMTIQKHTAPQTEPKRPTSSAPAFAALTPKQQKNVIHATYYEPLRPQSRSKPQPVRQPPTRAMVDATTGKPVKKTIRAEEIIPPKRKIIDEGNSEPVVVDMTLSTVQSGGTWLRILEHGDGPSIEIAWPTGTEGARLFDKLVRCYGLTLAINDRQGRLFADTGARGVKWDINLDLYSSFMRQTGAWHASEERLAINAIHARHGHIQGVPVRLFHRRVDARLLAGLGFLIGDSYTDSRVIQATYALEGERLIIQNIIMDGRTVPGKIDLSPAARCVAKGST